MGYFPEEKQMKPPVTAADGVAYQLERGPGMGYPTGGPPGSAYFPSAPTAETLATANPSGAANSPDEYPPLEMVEEAHPVENHRYAFKTQEQKANYLSAGGHPNPIWAKGETGWEIDFDITDLMWQTTPGGVPIDPAGGQQPIGYAQSLPVGGGPVAYLSASGAGRPGWFPPGYIWNTGGGQLMVSSLQAPPVGTIVAKVTGAPLGAAKLIVSGPVPALQLAIDATGKLYAAVGGVTAAALTGPVIAEEHGVAALSWDAATVKLYWKGAVVASAAASGPPGVPLYVSQSNGNMIFRILMINRALTPQEIATFNDSWAFTNEEAAIDRSALPLVEEQ